MNNLVDASMAQKYDSLKIDMDEKLNKTLQGQDKPTTAADIVNDPLDPKNKSNWYIMRKW